MPSPIDHLPISDEERHDPRCARSRTRGARPGEVKPCTCAVIARRVRDADTARAREIRRRDDCLG